MTILLAELVMLYTHIHYDSPTIIGIYVNVGAGLIVFWFCYWTMKANDNKGIDYENY
jgi:hypothetical protein